MFGRAEPIYIYVDPIFHTVDKTMWKKMKQFFRIKMKANESGYINALNSYRMLDHVNRKKLLYRRYSSAKQGVYLELLYSALALYLMNTIIKCKRYRAMRDFMTDAFKTHHKVYITSFYGKEMSDLPQDLSLSKFVEIKKVSCTERDGKRYFAIASDSSKFKRRYRYGFTV
jgi:hypothetical protein